MRVCVLSRYISPVCDVLSRYKCVCVLSRYISACVMCCLVISVRVCVCCLVISVRSVRVLSRYMFSVCVVSLYRSCVQ